MGYLILEPSPFADWHALVTEAESKWGNTLDVDLESYLVFLLHRFLQQPDLMTHTLGLEYLQAHQYLGQDKQYRLRDIGDICLLFSGLFPGIAQRRRVPISYFVGVGKSAYSTLAATFPNETPVAALYKQLQIHFVVLMDVLQCLRELGGEHLQLLPKQALQLWQDTGSKHALALLKSYGIDPNILKSIDSKILH
jgi:hypothetical protein